VQICERALDFTFEAAPSEDIEQRIDVGARFQFGDRALRAGHAGFQPSDLR
jgi:hypothetical protein